MRGKAVSITYTECVCVCMYVCMCVFYVCVFVCMCVYVFVCVWFCVCVFICMFVCVCMYVCMCYVKFSHQTTNVPLRSIDRLPFYSKHAVFCQTNLNLYTQCRCILVCNREDTASVLGQSVCDFRWTNWQSVRFLSGFPDSRYLPVRLLICIVGYTPHAKGRRQASEPWNKLSLVE